MLLDQIKTCKNIIQSDIKEKVIKLSKNRNQIYFGTN